MNKLGVTQDFCPILFKYIVLLTVDLNSIYVYMH